MDKPKGVVYVDVDINDDAEVNVAGAMRKALGWSPDQAIDSNKRNYNSSPSSEYYLRLTDSQRQRQRHLYGRFYKIFLVSPSSISRSTGEYRS
jgi:hypothetical protein